MKKQHTLTTLNINLKKFRLAKGLSQQELADHLGFKRSTYGQWENANIQPSIGQIIQLAEFYQTEVRLLYCGQISEISFEQNFVKVTNLKTTTNEKTR